MSERVISAAERIVLVTQQAAADRAAQQAERAAAPGELARLLVAKHNLYICDDTIYQVSTSNVVARLATAQIEHLVWLEEETLQERHRIEIIKFIKQNLLANHAIDISNDVVPLAFSDEPQQLTWKRLASSRADLIANPPKLADLKAFAHILDHCDDPTTLVLFLGSLLDVNSGRAQYLHLYGGGANGKSALFKSIEAALGEQHVIRAGARDVHRTHWGVALEGARLLLFADENNSAFFSSGRFKELTGEGLVTIEPKYESERKIRIKHKTAIISNSRIEISGDIADARRLLSVSMREDTGGSIGVRWWYDELQASGEEILKYCYSEFLKAIAVDPSIRAWIPQRKEVIVDAIERKYESYTEVIKELFYASGVVTDYLDCSEVHSLLSEALNERRSNTSIAKFAAALLSMGITQNTRQGKVKVYRGIKKGNVSDIRQQLQSKVVS